MYTFPVPKFAVGFIRMSSGAAKFGIISPGVAKKNLVETLFLSSLPRPVSTRIFPLPASFTFNLQLNSKPSVPIAVLTNENIHAIFTPKETANSILPVVDVDNNPLNVNL